MKNCTAPELLVTGVGVTSAIGQGKEAFTAALLQGRHRFRVMQRPGRQNVGPGHSTAFLGAEIEHLNLPERVSAKQLRTASFSARAAVATLDEAWTDANLGSVEPERIGLIVGGSNFQQRELAQTYETHWTRAQFLRPTYALSFMDSDLCGLCTEVFPIRGFAHTVGGASASGQVAVIQAIQALLSGQVDVCIALGALMDLSYWECQGFRSLGAMGSNRYAGQPELASRPFDRGRDGFIYGESCGALVIERSDSHRGRTAPYAQLKAWAMRMDRNRNPDPSFEGEVEVIQKCLLGAGWSAKDVDYINPHGTGSTLGDETELRAIGHCGLTRAHLNATKSIIGHGLSAAGAVELIAILLQMRAGQLHPTRNLDEPIDPERAWVRDQAISHVTRRALNLSMGFGGINTAVGVQSL